MLADLTELLLLHDSLHTRFLPDGEDGLEQVVDGSGELPVEVRTGPAERSAEDGAAFLGELAGRPFDHTREWPSGSA